MNPSASPIGAPLSSPGRGRIRGYTIMELMISLGASAAVVGALLLSSVSLNRALHSSRVYSEAYSDQRRVTDYISRDLRRAVGLAVTDSSGARLGAGDASLSVLVDGRASLILTLPAYYRSNARSDSGYDDPLDVVADATRLDYGTAAGLAPPVEVTYRRMFSAQEKCVCFVRQEAGVDEVIVRKADNLFVQVDLSSDAQSGSIKTWFRSNELGPTPLVSTFDRLLLRNPPLNYKP